MKRIDLAESYREAVSSKLEISPLDNTAGIELLCFDYPFSLQNSPYFFK